MNRQHIALIAAALAAPLIVLTSWPTASRDAILKIGGQNLHIETFGASEPTVVFEAGLGNDSTTWKFIAPPIATFARVVLYDRAGLGRSLPMTKNSPVTANDVVASLQALLVVGEIPPPYILVGHSLGGLYVQMFCEKIPQEGGGCCTA